MGYEIKLYLGTIGSINLDSKKWFDVVGTIDLCKPGYDSAICNLMGSIDKSSIIKDVYFYGSDGETKIIEDKYDSPLVAIPAKDVLKAINKDWETSKKDWRCDIGYRRFYMAVYLLYSFIKSFDKPYVILFGY